jgi:prophage regulatory protein
VSAETEIPDRLVKLDEVKRRIGLGKTLIYRLIQNGKVPVPSKLSPMCPAGVTGRSWLESRR